MFLREFEGSALFTKHGIPVPPGKLLERDTVIDEKNLNNEVLKIAKEFGGEFVLKAQLLKGGRGKSGLIVFANVKNLAEKIRELETRLTDRKLTDIDILAQKKLTIISEFYLAVLIDRHKRCPKLVFSTRGGVEIEETAEKEPHMIYELDIETDDDAEIESLIKNFFEKAKMAEPRAFEFVAGKLVKLFEKEDAVLAEINPLALTEESGLVALDSKVILDDNALAGHPEFERLKGRELSATEAEALRFGLAYVELDGDIAVVGNGAGLVMATLDALERKGGRPANFCDIGGGATSEMMQTALNTVLSKKNLQGLLINIFGGITRCDEIARGICEFVNTKGAPVPIAVRITGTNEEEAREILRGCALNAGAPAIKAFTFFDEAVDAASKFST